MDDETRRLVRHRAGNRCEYCKVHQQFYPDFTFHIEHIVAKQHHGSDGVENLGLACHLCNQKKGPNLSGIDPESGILVQLFNPRTQIWEHHLRVETMGVIAGLTAIGRATVEVLGMNSETRIAIRREILQLEAEDGD